MRKREKIEDMFLCCLPGREAVYGPAFRRIHVDTVNFTRGKLFVSRKIETERVLVTP